MRKIEILEKEKKKFQESLIRKECILETYSNPDGSMWLEVIKSLKDDISNIEKEISLLKMKETK